MFKEFSVKRPLARIIKTQSSSFISIKPIICSNVNTNPVPVSHETKETHITCVTIIVIYCSHNLHKRLPFFLPTRSVTLYHTNTIKLAWIYVSEYNKHCLVLCASFANKKLSKQRKRFISAKTAILSFVIEGTSFTFS